MRLGELRTVIREMDNRLIVKVASYDTDKGVEIFDVAFDMSNDNEVYLRIIDGDVEWLKLVISVEKKLKKIITLIVGDTLVILVQGQLLIRRA